MPWSSFEELRGPRAYRPSDGVVQKVQEVVRSVRRVRETEGFAFFPGGAQAAGPTRRTQTGFRGPRPHVRLPSTETPHESMVPGTSGRESAYSRECPEGHE